MIPSIEVENTQGTGSLLLSRGEEGITVTMTFVDFDSSLTAYDALAIETPMGTFPAEDLRDAVRILTGEPTGEPSDARVEAVATAICIAVSKNSWTWNEAARAALKAAEESK